MTYGENEDQDDDDDDECAQNDWLKPANKSRWHDGKRMDAPAASTYR